MTPRTALCALAALLLAGCGSTPTRYYVLAATTPPAEHANDAISVEITELRLPKYLDRPQIVLHETDTRLTLAEHDQWGGKLRDNMMRLLGRNLGRALGTSRIVLAPYRPSDPSAVRVTVEILRFERMADGYVRLDAQWRLTDGATDRTVSTRISRLRGERAVKAIDEVVEEMSRVFGRFSQEIAREIRKRFPAGE